jgi:hypothetical protein
MYCRIGPYKNYVGPYQIAEFLCFWTKGKDEHGLTEYPNWVHDFGNWLSGGDDKDSYLMKLCSWIENKRKRKEKVIIHDYDSWSADHTLAVVILPVLKQLRDTKSGSPFVDDEDVPDELKSSQYTLENDYDTDPSWFPRWDYIMDKMIWSFENIIDDDWEFKFHTGKYDNIYIPLDKDDNECAEEDAVMWKMDKGPNDTSHFDKEGYNAYSERIQEGLTLFGRYFRGLWD